MRFRAMTRPLAAAMVMGCVAGAPVAGHAQLESREAIELHNEILELRQEISQLQQLPSQANIGGSSLPAPEPEGGQPPPVSGPSGDVVAQLVVRVSALEEQMRTLEGRVSELENTEHRDHDDLAKQIGDLAFKLGQGPAAAQGGAAAAPDTGAEPASGGVLTPHAPPPVPPAAPARRTPELALKQGSAALARRDYPAAEAAAREVLALGHTPRSAEANFLLARAEAGQHQYKDAAATYFGVYKANPKSPRAAEALLGVANSLVGLNNMPLACQALAKLSAEFSHEDAAMRAGAASVRKRAGGCH